MPVYIRTAAGNEAALNPKSALPRKLRTLLISIDGRTRLTTYVNSLSSFGDVEALIESLLHAGLIQMLATQKEVGDGDKDVKNQDNSLFGRQLPTSWNSTDLSNTQAEGARSGTGSQPSIDDLLTRSKFQQAPVAPEPAFSTSSARPATTAHYQLRNVIGLMSDFVTQHMPMESLELVLTLEGLQTVEQVMASLKGYEAVISPVGEPARKHMATLRNVLSST